MIPDIHTLAATAPEIFLALVGMVLVLINAFRGVKGGAAATVAAIAALTVAIGFMLIPHYAPSGTHYAFGHSFVTDDFARFVKIILLAGGALSLMLAAGERMPPEYPTLVAFATLGMMVMVSAGDMLSLYVGLELQSLALYVLAAINRDDAKSSEAGLKYFVLGALSSGLILYGISLIYGYAGSIEFGALAETLKQPHPPLGLLFGLVFVCAALAFKIGAAPFHMWAPDVYEGAPTPVTAFFAAAPKVAALALFTRVLLDPFGGMADAWQQIVVFLAAASMAWGAFAGLVQSDIKRLLAYSSIANVGYALVGISTHSPEGVQALLIYLAIYFLNTLGAFGVVMALRRQGKSFSGLADFAGLAKTHPRLALAMVIFMFSLAGIPPFAGFFGKYFIFLAAVKAGLVPLAVFGVLTSVVGAYYYLRVIKLMYFDEPRETLDPVPEFGLRATVLIAALVMLLLPLHPSPVIDGALIAARSLIGG